MFATVVDDWDIYETTWMFSVPGDTNADGLVNIDDLNNVRNNFGATGPDDGTLAGDTVPFDGLVNIDDLNAVRNNFGAGATNAVPEPTASALSVIGFVLITIGVRQRSASSLTRRRLPSDARG